MKLENIMPNIDSAGRGIFALLARSIGIGRKKNRDSDAAYRIVCETQAPGECDSAYSYYKDEDGNAPRFSTREEAESYLSSLPGFQEDVKECFVTENGSLWILRAVYAGPGRSV